MNDHLNRIYSTCTTPELTTTALECVWLLWFLYWCFNSVSTQRSAGNIWELKHRKLNSNIIQTLDAQLPFLIQVQYGCLFTNVYAGFMLLHENVQLKQTLPVDMDRHFKAECCIFIHFWFLWATKWPTIPPTLQLLSLNKAFFSRLMSDIRLWQTCFQIMYFSWSWVVCYAAGHEWVPNICAVLLNFMQIKRGVKRFLL